MGGAVADRFAQRVAPKRNRNSYVLLSIDSCRLQYSCRASVAVHFPDIPKHTVAGCSLTVEQSDGGGSSFISILCQARTVHQMSPIER